MCVNCKLSNIVKFAVYIEIQKNLYTAFIQHIPYVRVLFK